MKKNNNFSIFIGVVLLITFGLASWGMIMYREMNNMTDLSSPKYQKVRKKIHHKKDKKIKSTGKINQKFINLVNKKYKEYQTEISTKDAFDEESISDTTLGIDG